MTRHASLSSLFVAIAIVPACGVSHPLERADAEWPREAVVSARHVVPAAAVAALELSALGDNVSVAWTERHHRRSVGSVDGGRTLMTTGPPVDAVGSVPVRANAFEVAHTRDRTWRVVPGADAFYDVQWTVEMAPDSGRPIAVQELCGLVSIVSVEPSHGDRRLVLRRYLPPRRPDGRGAQPIGSPIDLGGGPRDEGAVFAAAMLESAVVSWVDREAVHLVRVELPEVLCGMAPRPLS